MNNRIVDECAFCGKPEAEHGPPGASDYAREVGLPKARLCPTAGVTSQFFATREQMIGDKWRGTYQLPTCDDDGKPDFDGASMTVHVEQAKPRKPAAEVVFVTGCTTFAVVCVSPGGLERLADFLNDAADMLRHCSP